MNVDLAKLARLQMDLAERQSAVTGLGERYLSTHKAIQDIQVSMRPNKHWRYGEDISVFLRMPPDLREQYPDEVRAARMVAQLLEEKRSIYARQQALRPGVDALNRLVAACARYINEGVA